MKINYEKGITLIGLVVTIIVLIILSGVTIKLVVGENGLVTIAKQAIEELQKAREEEILNIIDIQLKIEQNNGEEIETDLSEEIARLLRNNMFNAGVIRDTSDNDNYIITFEETRNVFYYNTKTGQVSFQQKYDGKDDNIILTDADIQIGYTPEGFTNGNVTITIRINEKGQNLNNFIIQYSKDGSNWSQYTEALISTENETIYARVKHTLTGQIKAVSSINIHTIDKTIPKIGELTSTTNSITINAQDIAGTNEQASGIVGYAVTTSNEVPTNFTSCESKTSLNETVSTITSGAAITQNNTYYVWVKDAVGNVSQSARINTKTVTDLTSEDVIFTYTPNSWTNGNVLVKATTSKSTEGCALYLGTAENSCNTLASSGITMTENGNVYALLKDSTGQHGSYALGNVSKIDRTPPDVQYEEQFTVDINTTITESLLKEHMTATDNKTNTTIKNIVLKNSKAQTQTSISDYDIYSVTYNVVDEANNSITVTQKINVTPKEKIILTNLMSSDIGGFENGSISGWHNSSNISITNEISRTGRYSFKIDNVSSSGQRFPRLNVFNTEVKGKTIYARAYSYKDNASLGAGFYLINSETKTSWPSVVNQMTAWASSGIDEWKMSSLIMEDMSYNYLILMLCQSASAGSGYMYFDDLMIVDVSQLGDNVTKTWLDENIPYFGDTYEISN